MGRKISIVSGKGGVGKSTVACALALALSKEGNSVCLLDLDVGLNNLDVIFGLENKVVYDLGDCLNGKCRIKQAIISDSRFENLYLLPSAKGFDSQTSFDGVIEISDNLAQVFDFVIIDAPAGMGANFEIAIHSSNESLVVVTPHVSSLRDADKVISRIKGVGLQEIGVVVNRIRGDMVLRKEMLSHSQIEKLLKTPLFGVIPESDDINILSSFSFEKICRSKMADVFSVLANNIKFDKKIIYNYESKYRGFIGMLRRNIKRSV